MFKIRNSKITQYRFFYLITCFLNNFDQYDWWQRFQKAIRPQKKLCWGIERVKFYAGLKTIEKVPKRFN
jgi:ABC-type transporter Mla maintaining outer membrane lipid asymmetry permease subunit MlaE